MLDGLMLLILTVPVTNCAQFNKIVTSFTAIEIPLMLKNIFFLKCVETMVTRVPGAELDEQTLQMD